MSVPDRDQRIHKPTPKRILDFRKRGEVAISRDVATVLTIAGAGFFGLAFVRTSMLGFQDFFNLTSAAMENGRQDGIWDSFARAFAVGSVPTVLGGLVGAFLAAAVQVGAPPALAQLKFDPSRLFSPQTLLDLASPQAIFVRGLKATAKIAFVGLAALSALRSDLDQLASLPGLSPTGLLDSSVSTILRLLLHSGAALVVLAVLDYAWARRTMMQRMRMTSEELKREIKEQEGDPQIRRRRRQRMRELSRRRLLAVKTADVVVVNPTEYAVALRYKLGKDKAPRVVAKGRRLVAEKIREIARKNGIPIRPQPPLARALHKLVPEGKEIPAELYRAVAEVLAWVYRIKGGRQ